MPLASFAFTGWWAGHAPDGAGSTHGESSAAGWGGKGKGCASQCMRVSDGRGNLRHTAYAIPARRPMPSTRRTVLCTGAFSHQAEDRPRMLVAHAVSVLADLLLHDQGTAHPEPPPYVAAGTRFGARGHLLVP